MTEAQLIEGCKKRNPQAQRALYEQYKVTLFRVCLRYAKDRSEAQDMLQDGFIKIFTDLPKFRGEGALGGWLRRVMVNACLQHLRKWKNLFPATDVQQFAESHATNDNVIADLGAKELTQLIQTLPIGYRVVFNMYVVEGYSHKEIAEQLSVSVSTSKSQLFKAKAALRNKLEKILENS